ncbi:serine/threonine-protein kinase [Phytomonospora endophytica]|uniref:non-specific serine/threonine protein kinase n=1 Tax=Phytomonospora endophytica TaxID=714109 RepID=A0A841FL47_9ACTN|nr:serine/threonine-protein kinase [Phytomonospora endophytica]MBB6036886.1 serine/threonine protein kinase [Phytomonospora endophytica]GIG68080.1 hypothetical protein Pen01_43750 [Phytomonospora endophytica]
MPVGELVGGRYRLVSRIAGGGMGTVWNATDTRLDREVAVKILHPGLSADASFRTRFASEARLVAGLNTRSIATVHDYGEDEGADGVRAYLVMEFVDGRSLADILRRDGALPLAEAMRIIAEAAEGLHVAHRASIVHRDIKPANILIAEDGAVKLIDFGIARSLGDAGLTETGMVIGTVTYTAPEHLADEDPAPAADIYSLGIVAYECLTGRTPFASDKVPAIINGHLNQTPPPLPEEIPAAVSDAVMTALRKDPDDRWRTAERFARACREALDGVTPDKGAPPRPSYVAVMEALNRERPDIGGDTAALPDGETPAKPPRRLVPALAALGIAALLAGLIIWRPWGPPADDDRAVRDYHLPPLSSLSPGPAGEESNEPQVDGSSPPGETPGDDGTEKDRPEPEPDPGDGEPGEGGEDPNTAKVPDLKGVPVTAVAERLRAHGFDNSKPEAEMNWQGETCVVTEQTPEPGAVVDVGTLITFHYIDTYPQCLSEYFSLPAVPETALPPLAPNAVVSRDRAAVPRRRGGRHGRR